MQVQDFIKLFVVLLDSGKLLLELGLGGVEALVKVGGNVFELFFNQF